LSGLVGAVACQRTDTGGADEDLLASGKGALTNQFFG